MCCACVALFRIKIGDRGLICGSETKDHPLQKWSYIHCSGVIIDELTDPNASAKGAQVNPRSLNTISGNGLLKAKKSFVFTSIFLIILFDCVIS